MTFGGHLPEPTRHRRWRCRLGWHQWRRWLFHHYPDETDPREWGYHWDQCAACYTKRGKRS